MKIDDQILKFLHKKKNDNKFYDVSICFKKKAKKHVIDQYVVGLENNGYVIKEVEGYIPISAIVPGEERYANNSICKITPSGIDYYENLVKRKRYNILSVIAIILSAVAIVFSALSYFKNLNCY
jgi:hypothetical protein